MPHRHMGRLSAIVLGASAGGGYPQWNCRCEVCRLAWEGDRRVRARTQTSVAVSGDGEHWVLLNASPDLRSQLNATPVLHPRGERRGSPITAVILTGSEIDQIAGLLSLRERQAFAVFATAEALHSLDNPLFEVLDPKIVSRRRAMPDHPFVPAPGLEAELFTVPGKVPLYLERGEPEIGQETGANVGIEIRAGSARLAFVPGAAAVTPALKQRIGRADVLLFDATLYSDDEMIRSGTGTKTGHRMGHMPIDGPEGSLAALSDLSGRRIFIHINNTNPILVEASPERLRVEAAGWEIAHDGMEIVL